MNLSKKFHLILMIMLGSVITIIVQQFTSDGIVTMQVKQMISNETLAAVKNFVKDRLSVNRTSIVYPKTKPPFTKKTPADLSRFKPKILRWNNGLWEKWDNFCSAPESFDMATLKTPSGPLTIFIHDISVDRWVSRFIKKYGSWEGDIVNLIFQFLSRDPEMHLLDIGSHVGQFSLVAAKMGRMAIAVDPLYENVKRLCKSILQNDFCSQIKVVYSALSNTRTQVIFKRYRDNIGGTKIVEKNSNMNQSNNYIQTSSQVNKDLNYNSDHIKIVQTPSKFDKEVIMAVLLDDLLPLVPFKKAFMKMDVETHEHNVLMGGDNFFNSVDVRYILMEWMHQAKNPSSANQIIDFMQRHGYMPRRPSLQNHPLNYKDFSKWPMNVLWMKK